MLYGHCCHWYTKYHLAKYVFNVVVNVWYSIWVVLQILLFSVRLDNGVPNEHNDLSAGGLLYVHNHTWSAVCADNFTDLTAGQVCRELGHYDGRAILGSAYRYLARELLNGTLDCNGTEQDIRECYQDLDNCSSGQYASVFCLPHNHTYNDSGMCRHSHTVIYWRQFITVFVDLGMVLAPHS